MVADPPGSSQHRSIGNGHHPERHLAFPASTDRSGSWPVFKRMREGGNAIRRSAMALNLTQKQEVVVELAEVRSEEHTSELQPPTSTSSAVFCSEQINRK